MSREGVTEDAGQLPSRVLAAGGLLAAPAAIGRALVAAKVQAHSTAAAIPAPAPIITSTLVKAPVPGVRLHPVSTAYMHTFVSVPETAERFTTQANPGLSGLIDTSGWAVENIVVSRLAADGSLIDSMTLPDCGHGMGLGVRMGAEAPVSYPCWFAPDPSGHLQDVVRLPYAPGIAGRTATSR